MQFYFLSLGSNLNPEKNVVAMLYKLLELSPTLDVSRVVKTQAVGFESNYYFLNLAVRISSEMSALQLKTTLIAIEESLGRNLKDPYKKLKDRPADIDILFSLEKEAQYVPTFLLPTESYVKPTLLDLIAYLELDCEEKILNLEDVTPLWLSDIEFGNRALTLSKNQEEAMRIVSKVANRI